MIAKCSTFNSNYIISFFNLKIHQVFVVLSFLSVSIIHISFSTFTFITFFRFFVILFRFGFRTSFFIIFSYSFCFFLRVWIATPVNLVFMTFYTYFNRPILILSDIIAGPQFFNRIINHSHPSVQFIHDFRIRDEVNEKGRIFGQLIGVSIFSGVELIFFVILPYSFLHQICNEVSFFV